MQKPSNPRKHWQRTLNGDDVDFDDIVIMMMMMMDDDDDEDDDGVISMFVLDVRYS